MITYCISQFTSNSEKNLNTHVELTTMDVYDTIYAILDANNNTIRGRTVIQKIVYLTSQKIPNLDVPPYKAHYYGPFSRGLGWALETMVSCYFLYEDNPPGSMYEGYKYSLTKDGHEIVKTSKEENAAMFEKIAEIVKVCRDFCDLKPTPLSYAAKIHYLLNSHTDGGMSFPDAVEYAKKLQWKVSENNVEQGVKLLERLELVTASR